MATALIIPQLLVALKSFFPLLMVLSTLAAIRTSSCPCAVLHGLSNSLITVNLYHVSTVMKAMYYITLPHGTRGLTNGINIQYFLVLFLGINDLCILTPIQVQTDILVHVQKDDPGLLKASDFNLRTATTDSNDINLKIDRKILKLAWHQICASVFTEICTQATLDHIK
jgi:hypothetical protein